MAVLFFHESAGLNGLGASIGRKKGKRTNKVDLSIEFL
jgi:hypothetical protein